MPNEPPLTQEQHRILSELAAGQTYKQIAFTSGSCYRRVRNMTLLARDTLGAGTTLQMMAKFVSIYGLQGRPIQENTIVHNDSNSEGV